MAKLLRLFFEMFKIALFVVGGGYAIIAVADDTFSRKLKWTKEGELLDALFLFQMFPGIMAGHCALYVGRKVAGVAGSAVALVAVILPSLAIFLAVAAGYGAIPLNNPWLLAVFAALRAALAGIIAGMIFRGWKKNVKGVYGYGAVSFALVLLLCGANPAAILVTAMLAGVVKEFAPRSASGRSYLSIGAVVPLFLKYGSLAFGGGYVLVPMYIHDFVGASAPYLQLNLEDFANLMALTQMTPGPIGINAATFFGFRLGGVAGAALATVSLVLPGSVMLSLALAYMERFRESRLVKGILGGVSPVAMALMTAAALSFAAMSLWHYAPEEGISFDFAAIAFAIFTAVATIRRIMGAMPAIFLCAGVSVCVYALKLAFFVD